ncbi:MAG: sulfatase-like hydrolase/transferase [Acidobacteriota bacterium]|nr:sulfatase-like hydrolase/transferase [Acidobacteriota bacterium]
MKLSRRHLMELTALSALPARAADRPPNLIVLLGDDHRADALGASGNPVVKTPQLDRLAGEGVLFENHFATTPICCASRASIMLGEYTASHKIYDFATPLTPAQVSRAYWTQLSRAGYHTGFIGKFGVGNKMPEDSFDVWMGFPGQGNYFPHGATGPHLNHIMRDQASEFIRSAPSDKPFCLSVSFKAPHVQDEDPRQYLPSADTAARYENVTAPPPRGAAASDINRFPIAFHRAENRRRWGVRFGTPELYQASMKGYYRLITGIDDVIGSLRGTLAELSLDRNTVILYSADHGIFNGEHGFAGKWFGHEESVRIPLIVHDPRLPAAARGKRCRARTLNIDLHPTVLDLAGIGVHSHPQGRSVAPYLANPETAGRAIHFFDHRFPYNGWIPSSEGIRTDRWKFIRYTDSAAPFEELYDLNADPSETNNLIAASEHRRARETLTRYCDRWKQALAAWRPETAWNDPVSAVDLRRDGLT